MRVDAGAPRPSDVAISLPARRRPNRPARPCGLAKPSMRSAPRLPSGCLCGVAPVTRSSGKYPCAGKSNSSSRFKSQARAPAEAREASAQAWLYGALVALLQHDRHQPSQVPLRERRPPDRPGPCGPFADRRWRWPAPCCETRRNTMRIMRDSAGLLDPEPGPRDVVGPPRCGRTRSSRATSIRATMDWTRGSLQEVNGNHRAREDPQGEARRRKRSDPGPPPGGQIPLDKGWEVPSHSAARKPPLLVPTSPCRQRRTRHFGW